MRGGRINGFLLLLLAVVINLPLVHSAWTGWRVDREGVDVRAEVTDDQVLREGTDDAAYVLVFDYPDDVTTDPTRYRVVVDEPAYDAAVAAGEVDVRVLPDRPQAFSVEGQQTSRVAIWVALVADVLLVLTAVALWRRARDRAARDAAEPVEEDDGPPVSPA